jgi:hypothetical protein
MKKAVIALVIVSLFAPSLAFSSLDPVQFCQDNNLGHLGPNACCVYACFDDAKMIAMWASILANCFPIVGGIAFSAEGTRQTANFGLGPNASCVYDWSSPFWFKFRSCVKNECFPSDG